MRITPAEVEVLRQLRHGSVRVATVEPVMVAALCENRSGPHTALASKRSHSSVLGDALWARLHITPVGVMALDQIDARQVVEVVAGA